MYKNNEHINDTRYACPNKEITFPDFRAGARIGDFRVYVQILGDHWRVVPHCTPALLKHFWDPRSMGQTIYRFLRIVAAPSRGRPQTKKSETTINILENPVFLHLENEQNMGMFFKPVLPTLNTGTNE